ncbi:hypothetical protein B296_00033727 [Ensete ventricosum]|uniref:Uncharacterized protein n=1 Tax=Ensete ventricosum TaxID=4639 RepID=A0A426ZWH0_ENSVE|nr:hypothetical protein B296_00033727 [Ensete ventricosum]
MVSRIIVEQFEAIQHTRDKSPEGLDHAEENIISTSPATGWRRPYLGLVVCLSSTKGNTKVLKQVVKRDEEATTSPEGLTYPKGGTSVESSIPCSHGGRASIVKGTEEVENVEANSKYQDKAEGQRPRYFIRPMSTGFSIR